MNALCVLLLAVVWFLTPSGITVGFSPFLSDYRILLAVGAVSTSGLVASFMGQYAYLNERIGVIAPFGEMGRVLTIVAGFFIFSGKSATTFVFALAAGLAILATSVDFKNFSVNRYCGALAASGVLRAFAAVCSVWILSKIASVTFASSDVLFATAVTAVFAFREGFPKYDRDSYVRMGKGFFASDVLWLVSYLISLFLVQNLGIVTASLLGMSAMVATVVYGRFFLKERIGGKTWALAAFVASCVLA